MIAAFVSVASAIDEYGYGGHDGGHYEQGGYGHGHHEVHTVIKKVPVYIEKKVPCKFLMCKK